MSDKKRNESLATYRFRGHAQGRRSGDCSIASGWTRWPWTRPLTDIRQAQNYLDGIAAATPMVNAIVVGMGDRLTQIQAQVPPIAAALEGRIEADYAGAESELHFAGRPPDQGHAGDDDALQGATGGILRWSIRFSGRIRLCRNSCRRAKRSTHKSIAAAETHLTERLSRLDTFIHQLDPDVALYMAKLRELEECEAQRRRDGSRSRGMRSRSGRSPTGTSGRAFPCRHSSTSPGWRRIS